LLGEVVRLRDENAARKEEIARLKGLKGRPKLKPSGMERATPERASRTKTKRSKRGTTVRRVVHEERVLAIAAPPGSRFKGYEDVVVQDLRLEARVIRYRRQRWLTPDGQSQARELAAPRQSFTPDVLATFERDPELIDVVALHLLERHFAPGLPEEILEAADLELGTPVATRRRDLAFRLAVLEAYLAECCVCGFSLHLSTV
jgi:hypothetical protein